MRRGPSCSVTGPMTKRIKIVPQTDRRLELRTSSCVSPTPPQPAPSRSSRGEHSRQVASIPIASSLANIAAHSLHVDMSAGRQTGWQKFSNVSSIFNSFVKFHKKLCLGIHCHIYISYHISHKRNTNSYTPWRWWRVAAG